MTTDTKTESGAKPLDTRSVKPSNTAMLPEHRAVMCSGVPLDMTFATDKATCSICNSWIPGHGGGTPEQNTIARAYHDLHSAVEGAIGWTRHTNRIVAKIVEELLARRADGLTIFNDRVERSESSQILVWRCISDVMEAYLDDLAKHGDTGVFVEGGDAPR